MRVAGARHGSERGQKGRPAEGGSQGEVRARSLGGQGEVSGRSAGDRREIGGRSAGDQRALGARARALLCSTTSYSVPPAATHGWAGLGWGVAGELRGVGMGVGVAWAWRGVAWRGVWWGVVLVRHRGICSKSSVLARTRPGRGSSQRSHVACKQQRGYPRRSWPHTSLTPREQAESTVV